MKQPQLKCKNLSLNVAEYCTELVCTSVVDIVSLLIETHVCAVACCLCCC